MSFASRLVVAETDQPHEWALEASLVYRGNRDSWTVPRGYVTDFASVPRVFWNAFPPYGKHTKAAVVHDYLYTHRPCGITRRDADGVFRRIMRELGVSWWRRRAMHAAVRLGGWVGWRRSRRKELR